MPVCWHCNAESTADHHQRVVYNNTELHGPWSGWRMAGRDLVSPDGERISTERLRGLMFRAASEARLSAVRARNSKRGHQGVVKVLTIPCRELRDRYSGHAAG